MLDGIRPEPPLWAIEAGLPEPRDEESFCSYIERLGLDCAPLLEELTPQTAELVNLRLHSLLMDKMPREFRAHVETLSAAVIEPSRLVELRRFAGNFMPR